MRNSNMRNMGADAILSKDSSDSCRSRSETYPSNTGNLPNKSNKIPLVNRAENNHS